MSLVVFITRGLMDIKWSTGSTFGTAGAEYFKYFTSLSNFYNGLVSLYLLVLSIIHFKDDEYRFSKISKMLYLSAVVGVFITFLITVTFLQATISNPKLLYEDELIFFHVIHPILSVLSYVFLFKSEPLRFYHVFVGEAPLFIYSVVYSIMVLSGNWSDHYGFTFGGHKWAFFIVFPSIILLGYGASYLLEFLNNKFYKL